jgi:hypothetical protein
MKREINTRAAIVILLMASFLILPFVQAEEQRFQDKIDGTVKDNLTGLIWLKDASPSDTRMNWTDAVSYCNSLAEGTFGLTDGSNAGDWRLPSLDELQSLVDDDNENPALPSDHPFEGIQTSYNYWSGTSYGQNNVGAWQVSMNDGSVRKSMKYSKRWVWPVRDDNDVTGSDGDGIPEDVCIDIDEDEICDDEDNCLDVANPEQEDLDNDSIGDLCDECIDIDEDEICDDEDNCPDIANPEQEDVDGDGAGDSCDTDDDNDGISDEDDGCPYEDASGLDADTDGCIDTIEYLLQLIYAMNLDKGIENSLISKVKNAQKSIKRENITAAINKLQAFINQVEAQKGKKIPQEEAEMLILYAGNLINSF